MLLYHTDGPHIMRYILQACGLSDIGLVRQNNEDYWAQILEDNFFVLADGMGGHLAGEVASREAVTILCRLLKEAGLDSFQTKSLDELQDLLRMTIQQLNGKLFALSCQNDLWKGMGTTLCCLLVHEKGIVYGHVGDSRIYRLRQNTLEQLTNDHSLLRELVDLGQIEEGHAEGFLYRNVLTRAVGTEPIVEPEVRITNVMTDDQYLMCSDGLTDLLSSDEIKEILAHATTVQDAAKKLVKIAKQKGGYDNITVLLIKVCEKHERQGSHRKSLPR